MGLKDLIRSQLIDIIEWTDDSNDTMVYRYERQDNEIKYGAKLIVRESQVAVFVNMGQIADVFQPGMYTLETKNLPILATLLGWKYGFESPFKCEVYFVNTRRFTDLKWGTKNPVIRRDAEFGMVRLRAFGTYAMRVTDAATFIREIVGTDSHFTTDEVVEQLRNIVVSRFSDAVAESAIPMLDLASNYDELGVKVLASTSAPAPAWATRWWKRRRWDSPARPVFSSTPCRARPWTWWSTPARRRSASPASVCPTRWWRSRSTPPTIRSPGCR